MTGFWVAALALMAVVLGVVIVPLLRPAGETGRARSALNVAIHRERLRELDEDLASDTLSRDQYEAARAEVERDLLDDAAVDAPLRPEQVFWERWAAVFVGLLVPVVALSLYLYLRPAGLEEYLEAGPSVADAGASGAHDINRAITALEKRLAENPRDAQGWFMLGRSLVVVNRYADAEQAFARAQAIAGDVPDLLAEYAEVLGLATGGRMGPRSAELLARALASNPIHPKSLWLSGVAAFQREDYLQAIAFWERLRAQFPEASEESQALSGHVAQARALQQQGGAKPAAGTAQPASATVRLRVEIAPEVLAQVGPEDVVFVFARPKAGPRMPLAIKRLQVRDLPATVELSDADSMSPQARLSGAASVAVGARISRSGQATPKPGDFEGEVADVKVGGKAVVGVRIARAL